MAAADWSTAGPPGKQDPDPSRVLASAVARQNDWTIECAARERNSMSIRIAAIGVSHWHSLYDAAYLRRLARMPDVQLVGLHDPDPQIAAQRSAAVGNPPTFTDYAQMLGETHPDFVLALGDHRAMATTAHYLLDHGYPFLMEKPMGYNAAQVRSVAEKAATTHGFAAVSLPQRLQPFAM